MVKKSSEGVCVCVRDRLEYMYIFKDVCVCERDDGPIRTEEQLVIIIPTIRRYSVC